MLSRLLSFFLLFVFVISAHAASPAPASSSSLTYQGRILKSDGTPFEKSNVSFVFQLLDPSGQCVIYQEQIDGINMSHSGGVFDVPIGMGSVQYITGVGASSVVDVFNNDSSIAYHCGACSSSGSTYNCSATATPYNPVAADGRLLRVAFYDGSGWKTITPDNVIRSVPYAAFSHSAQKLGKNSVADFILKNDINNSGAGSITCDSGKFLTWDASTKKMGCAAVTGANGGTVTSITAGAGLNGGIITSSGTIDLATTSVTSGTYGSVTHVPVFQVDAYGRITSVVNTTIAGVSPGGTAGGDLSGNYPNPTIGALNGKPLAITSATGGQFLKYDGSSWINSVIQQSDIANLSATLGGYIPYSSIPTCNSASSTLTFVSATDTFLCTAISITGSKVLGDIAGNAAGFTGALTGDVTGTQGATVVRALQGKAVATTAPTANQVLQFDGSQWTPATISTTPSGTAGGDLTGVYPNPTLSSVVTAGTGTKITYDAKGRVVASSTPNTLAGYSISDAVKNGGGTGTITSGIDASKSSLTPTTGDLFVATDSQKIYRYNSASWDLISSASGSGGTVTNVTATSPLTSSGGVAPNITIDQASGATNGYLSSTDWNTFNNKLGTGSAFSGDVSGTSATTSVDKIKGKAVSPVAYSAGQVLRYNGTNWVNAVISAATDLTGTLAIANGGTGATSATGARTNLGLGSASVVDTGSFAGNIPLLGIGGLVANQLCTSDGTASGIICNSTMPVSSQWSTSGSNIYYNSGNVGIGTSAPSSKLQVNGVASFTNNATSPANIGRALELATDTTFGGVHNDHTGIRLFAYDMNGWGTAKLGIQVSNNWGGYIGGATPAKSDMAMVVGQSETLIQGNVGIGTVSATAKLDVNGSINVNNNRITNVATPLAAGDVATKAYVDAAAGGAPKEVTLVTSTSNAFPSCAAGFTAIACQRGYGPGAQAASGKFTTTKNTYFNSDGMAIAGLSTQNSSNHMIIAFSINGIEFSSIMTQNTTSWTNYNWGYCFCQEN